MILTALSLAACAVVPEPTRAPSSSSTPNLLQATKPATEPTKTAEDEPTTTQQPSPTSPDQPTESSTPAPRSGGEGQAQPPISFPNPNAFTWRTIVSGFDRPADVSGDGFGRLLVLDQHGRIFVVENDAIRARLFLDIRDRVGLEGNEMGLLGLALHPNYRENGLFYVNYTDKNSQSVIARYSAVPQDALADANSEKVLFRVKQPYSNHNGGGMAFGPDNYLYIGLGDGGSRGDPHGYGQDLNILLGKLLRIDVDGGDPYAIPADNPYSGGGGKAEIWVSGLRNPWRFSFDALTGDLYIGDVGQNQWEEIDFLAAGTPGGANMGWNIREASHPFNEQAAAEAALVDPIFEYPHPEGCSVTGGFVYRGSELPEFNGIYVFGDYCTGRIWGLYRDADGLWQHSLLFETGLNISSFGIDDMGELYLLSHPAGAVLKLVRK
jgi:glucose/arabinose dehydrogenase